MALLSGERLRVPSCSFLCCSEDSEPELEPLTGFRPGRLDPSKFSNTRTFRESERISVVQPDQVTQDTRPGLSAPNAEPRTFLLIINFPHMSPVPCYSPGSRALGLHKDRKLREEKRLRREDTGR